MSVDIDALLERAAERITESERKANEAIDMANRVTAANAAALLVLDAHLDQVKKLAAKGVHIVNIEFVEGVVETMVRDMKAALQGKRPEERFDA